MRRWSIAVVVVVVVLTAAGWPFYVSPHTDTASAGHPADAIVALGGSYGTAFYAKKLLDEGAAPNLVISDPYGPWAREMHAVCPDRDMEPRTRSEYPPEPALPHVTCFQPSPSTTRGEAMEIARLAEQNGWDDVIVVAPTFHITRARIIVSRCYPGTLRMVDPHNHYALYVWPYQYLYQTAGFVKVALRRSC